MTESHGELTDALESLKLPVGNVIVTVRFIKVVNDWTMGVRGSDLEYGTGGIIVSDWVAREK